MEAIKGFFGQYACFSNFYKHEKITYKGMVGDNVEVLFQAEKAKSPEQRKYVLKSGNPSEAKRRGRKVDMRVDWESVKIGIMTDLLRLKFAIPRLRKKLLETGDAVS